MLNGKILWGKFSFIFILPHEFRNMWKYAWGWKKYVGWRRGKGFYEDDFYIYSHNRVKSCKVGCNRSSQRR